MYKHVCIAYPYDTKEYLIRNIGVKNDKYNHLIFDNNKLIKIINVYPFSDDIIKMKEGNEYEFINGLPKPFYDFFNKYYQSEVTIYSLNLTSPELEDIILTNKLIDEIINYNYDSVNHIQKIQSVQYQHHFIYNDFVNNYVKQYTENDKHNFKINYVKSLLEHKFNQHQSVKLMI
jgi:hypothetical protein